VKALLLLAGCWLSLAAQAAVIEGHVTHVSDGDTVWVRTPQGGPPRAVRIEGIDAPEICQPGGEAARDALARRVLHRFVRVRTQRDDDWGRALGRLEHEDEDVAGWLVRGGHAWSYRYRRDPGPYAREQRLARQARRGLWAGAQPMEPRTFRQFNGPCHSEPTR
jgi:micrococcal nuclease